MPIVSLQYELHQINNLSITVLQVEIKISQIRFSRKLIDSQRSISNLKQYDAQHQNKALISPGY